MESVGDRVGRADLDVDEANGREARFVLCKRQRAGNAADVAPARGALLGRERVVGDDIADADPPAGSKDAGDLAEDRRLVGREVDDAVADHDVDRRRGEGDRLDRAADEFDVVDARVGGIPDGESQHLVGHVDAEGTARGTHTTGREDHVDPAAGAEVEDALTLAELGDRSGIAAAEAGEERRVGKGIPVRAGVQDFAEDRGIDGRGGGAATGRLCGRARQARGRRGRLGIPGPNGVVDRVLIEHRLPPVRVVPDGRTRY